MKRPGRRDGQGGPESGEEPGDEERARAERSRIRAQKRLAAKAGGESADGSPAKGKAASKAKPENPSPARAKGGRARTGRPTAKQRGRRGAGVGAALKQGVSATRSQTRGVPSRAGGAVLKALGAVFAIFFAALGFVIGVILFVLAFLRGPVRAGLEVAGRFLRLASRVVTPARALTVVVAGAAVLLALSQFADYRSVSVGTDAYAEVETVAPAPEKERDETGSAHSYLMLPLAIVALGLLAAAILGRRRRLLRGVVAIGIVAVLVSLLVDRPAGLDPGDLELAFDGVRATLLGGFYAQLFSGALLAAAALLLSRELRPAAAADEVRGADRERGRLPRRPPPKAEGARA